MWRFAVNVYWRRYRWNLSFLIPFDISFLASLLFHHCSNGKMLETGSNLTFGIAGRSRRLTMLRKFMQKKKKFKVGGKQIMGEGSYFFSSVVSGGVASVEVSYHTTSLRPLGLPRPPLSVSLSHTHSFTGVDNCWNLYSAVPISNLKNWWVGDFFLMYSVSDYKGKQIGIDIYV